METRANYVLIGLFTLLGILGAFGFLIWLAKVQIDRQYDYYDILFDSVEGLSTAAEVKFNGLTVGQVTQIALYEQDASKVRVRVEVAANTPIKQDTKAQLQSQGVTGVSFVALTGGTATAPDLDTVSEESVPIIQGQRSVVQQITEDAPDILSETLSLLKNLESFTGSQNQAYVTNILQNVDSASKNLQTALDDFSSISETIKSASGEIGKFTEKLDPIASSVETALTTADSTMTVAKSTLEQIEKTLTEADGAIKSVQTTFDSANTILEVQAPEVVSRVDRAVAAVETAIFDISTEASATLRNIDVASIEAGDRLSELKTTLEDADAALKEARTALTSVTTTSTSINTLVSGDGAALVSEARTTLQEVESSVKTINEVVTNEVPAIVADVRGAVETASRVIDEVGADVSQFSSSLTPLTDDAEAALTAATSTFTRANTSLARLDVAMGTAERTLTSAQKTFDTATFVIDQEVAPTAADIRSAAAELKTGVDRVTADLPEITAEIRATVARADEVMSSIESVVQTSAPPIRRFATTGLPEFTRFAEEARALVIRLDRLTARIERDPARFFIGNQPAEFRR